MTRRHGDTARGRTLFSSVFSFVAASPCQLNQHFPSRLTSPFPNEELISLQVLSTAFSAAFNADGTRVATASADGSVRVWKVARDNSVGRDIQHADRIAAAGYYSSKGLRILTERDGSFQLRNATTGEALGTPFSQPGSAGSATKFNADHLVFSPNDSRVLIIESTGRSPCCLRNVATGEILGKPFAPPPTDVAFSEVGPTVPDGGNKESKIPAAV